MRPSFKLVLAASLGLNLVCLAGGAYVIYMRGGLDYLKSVAAPRMETDEFPGAYWAGRQSHFTGLQKVVADPIVFVGDSLTEAGEWSELFSGNSRIVNRGIGSDTTLGVRMRWDSILAMHPQAVFLMIGVNDRIRLAWQPHQTATAYTAIVEQFRKQAPYSVLYIQSVLPVADGIPNRSNADIMEINRQLRALADGNTIQYVDLFQGFLEPGRTSLESVLSSDGIHLNGAGYARWREAIAPLIQGAGMRH